MKFHKKVGTVTMTGSVILLVLLSALSENNSRGYCGYGRGYYREGFNFLMNCLSLYGRELKYVLVLCVILFCVGFLWYKAVLNIPNSIKYP